ncbi:ArsR/SmtB family transcription factor [Streptomyces sp. cg2]|uniref:ArsR/SmtB family transcription factor n=1 Tax=Streptomyces sp. cg2 TaxID=3238799 RepID=UPI0034E2579D
MQPRTDHDGDLLPVCATNVPFAVSEIAAVTAALKAIAGPVRLRLLQALADRDLSIGQLAEYIGAPYATVSQHLAQLRAAGLVTVAGSGSHVLYGTSNPHLPAVLMAARQLAAHPVHPARPVRPAAGAPAGVG